MRRDLCPSLVLALTLTLSVTLSHAADDVPSQELIHPQTASVSVNTASSLYAIPEPIVCRCSAVVGTSNDTYDLGTIGIKDITPNTNPTRHKSTCRKLRHHCRKLCGDSLDLNQRSADSSQKELGYRLCSVHGMSAPGGWPVYSQAVLEGCRQHLPILPVKAPSNLCCGHTYINISDKNGGYNAIKAFGWNPDCKTDLYIL